MLSEPRLSSRLLVGKGNHSSDLHNLVIQRSLLLKKVHDTKQSVSSFDVGSFLSDSMSYAIIQIVKTCYRKYLDELKILLDKADHQNNAAKTLYNIIARQSRYEAFKEAVSYFGKMNRSDFDKVANAAESLSSASGQKSKTAITDSFEFGSEYKFEAPSLNLKVRNAFTQSRESISAAASGKGSSSNSNLSSDVSTYQWLLEVCRSHLSSNPMPFDATQLAGETVKTCLETQSPDELQIRLFDLLGEGGFEAMLQLMERGQEIGRLDVDKCQRQLEASQSQSNAYAAQESSFASEFMSGYPSLNAMGPSSVSQDWLQQVGFTDDFLLQERALGLQKGKHSGGDKFDENWLDNLAPQGTLQYHEKRGLPVGAEKKVGPGYEEVFLPAAKRHQESAEDALVEISSIEEKWARLAFEGTTKLNRIQSKVFPCAYKSSENMLICAPTGAGKTNIAMLSFLQLVRQHTSESGEMDLSAVKAVYIAPMKALAQEVVAKFSERLKPLGLVVKEFTGDMQLTKQEVADSQLLVCTPEKYDVITRKGGEGSLGTLVSLIIIDEVHLLADDRGAVIETIVARTQRYVETSQKFVRIVGLSATLPNYQDVASFLRVNPRSGLFFFGPEFRPIPLDQSFLGITEKSRVKQKDQMNRHAFEKLVTALERGKQVMIFVHARKETSRTAEAMADLSGKAGTTSLFENVHHEKYTLFKREVDKSRSLEVQQLFAKGVGVHHAGMLRADRSLTERLFEVGLIKLLCCTSTLAWGVNLPAHTVIIKGTELYDPERGGFVDLSILDVLQIFGRAGRPQYDTTGHAILITQHKSLAPYLALLTQQAPIESGLIKSLADHLNAEIVNGTISNIKEAASWLSYTFLFVRMCKNPVAYGMRYDEVFADPRLEGKRMQLVVEAAELLDNCMMVRFDKRSGNLGVTDLGRIASHYYLKHGTIEAFNNMLTPHLSDPDALHVLCSSAEFDQLKVRPEELVEIDTLKKDLGLKIKSSVEDTAGKVNVLLQGYMNGSRVQSFTLQSDTNYVATNTGRIARALFEICLKRGWSTMAGHYLTLCKAIDRRMRMDQCPLRQFGDEIPREVIKRLEETDCSMDRLMDMEGKEVASLIHNQKLGQKVLSFARKLPHLHVEAQIQPITRGILKLTLSVSGDFEWTDRYHGYAQPFWIWVEDGDNEYIYHSEYFVLLKRQKDVTRVIEFTIPVREPLPPQYYVRTVSDSWVGCETTVALSFKDLILPNLMTPHTNLLDMHPVPKEALGNASYEALYKFSHFNPIQSQTFHTLYHSDHNVLVGAPTGSGKTITAEIAILRLKNERPGAKTIYVAPLKALARERLSDWKKKLGLLGMTVLELTGDVTPDPEDLRRADVLIVTPEKWDGITRGWQKRDYVKRVELVIIDEIHLLGVDRGPVLEVIVSRMRFIAAQTASPIRFVGLSTALANPRDLADWLGIGDVGVYNFRPSVRPIPMSIHIQGFPGKHYCPRMATMNKPAYAAILEHSPTKPSLIFVSSRRQTRLTALDLISYCAADDNPKQFLHMPEDEITAIASTLRDKALKDTIVFGIAIHHAGLDNHDRTVVEELFYSGKVQILVCTSTLAWGVNLPCHLVIVKGTEFFDAKQGRYVDFPVTDVLQMMGRAGRPQFDETGVACIFVHEPKKTFYRKFLHEPFPVESSLQHQLHEHFNAEIASGSVTNVRDCVEYLTWTYFFRRLVVNPSYYGLLDSSPVGIEKHLVDMSSQIVKDLEKFSCITVNGEGDYTPTALGKIASYYYLHYRTVGLLKSRFLHLETISDKTDDVHFADQLLYILSDAYEFAELPVRHNEELLNADLAATLPRPVDPTADMSSAHTKTFLLLQAHMHRLALPISDFINDTKSVLDQVPRVLSAMVDVAVEMRLGRVVLGLLRISQMVIQGLFSTSSELYQLPGVTSTADCQALSKSGIKTLRDVLSRPVDGISRLLQRSGAELFRVVRDLSTFSLDAAHIRVRTVAEGVTFAATDASVHEVDFTIVRRTGSIGNAGTGSTVYAPKYHKRKTASYWCVLVCEQLDGAGTASSVLAVRKISTIGRQMQVALPFSLSGEQSQHVTDGRSRLTLHLLCDALMGTDERLEVKWEVKE